MDDLDRKILFLLSENARMPVKEIAEKVSLTSPAVSSRIHRMEQSGVIGGYTIRLHTPEPSEQVNALISVSVPPDRRDDFLHMLQSHLQVLHCFHVTGSHSFISKVQCRNMEALEHLITSFQVFGPTSTQIILATVVDRQENEFDALMQ